jgi:hypothetical protein
VLSSFERLNSPKTVGVVLTLVVALLAGTLFFVYLPSRADERSLARPPARAPAPGELLEGGKHPALKPPLGLNVEPAARVPGAEADAEATGRGTNAPAREEGEGPPRHAPGNASRPTGASVRRAPVGGVSAASTVASTAAAASSASTAATTTAGTAQYASASTAQYGGAAAIRTALTMVPRRAALQRSP